MIHWIWAYKARPIWVWFEERGASPPFAGSHRFMNHHLLVNTPNTLNQKNYKNPTTFMNPIDKTHTHSHLLSTRSHPPHNHYVDPTESTRHDLTRASRIITPRALERFCPSRLRTSPSPYIGHHHHHHASSFPPPITVFRFGFCRYYSTQITTFCRLALLIFSVSFRIPNFFWSIFVSCRSVVMWFGRCDFVEIWFRSDDCWCFWLNL